MNFKRILALIALAVCFSGIAGACLTCYDNDVWDFDENGEPVEKKIECGDDEAIGRFCQGNSVFEAMLERSCKEDSYCDEVQRFMLIETCDDDGYYGNEYRDYKCSDGRCVYVVTHTNQSDDNDDPCDSDEDCNGQTSDPNDVNLRDIKVWIDGREIKPDSSIYKAFGRGDEIEVEIEAIFADDYTDVQIEALILGYEHGHRERDLVSDITRTFDAKENRAYSKKLYLTIPEDMEIGDLKLRLIVSDRSHDTWAEDYNLDVNQDGPRVAIRDIFFDPSDWVIASRGAIANVRVKNLGEDVEEGIRVRVEIPQLGVSATEYIDEIWPDDSETTDDMYLRLPECVDEGNYTVIARVFYDDGYEVALERTSLNIENDDSCDDRNSDDEDEEDSFSGVRFESAFEKPATVSVTGSQNVITEDTAAVYPISITNNGLSSKTYILSVKGADEWGNARIDPSAVVVVGAGNTEVPYLYMAAKNGAQSGSRTFTLEVASGEELQRITLAANLIMPEHRQPEVTGSVVSGISTGKAGMEVLLLVLLIFVVLVGIMIAAGKIKEGN